jgi:hypothetical protein
MRVTTRHLRQSAINLVTGENPNFLAELAPRGLAIGDKSQFLVAAANAHSAVKVIVLDFALGAIILLFRCVKAVEKLLSTGLNVTHWPAFSQPREAGKPERVGGLICFGVYILAVFARVWAL